MKEERYNSELYRKLKSVGVKVQFTYHSGEFIHPVIGVLDQLEDTIYKGEAHIIAVVEIKSGLYVRKFDANGYEGKETHYLYMKFDFPTTGIKHMLDFESGMECLTLQTHQGFTFWSYETIWKKSRMDLISPIGEVIRISYSLMYRKPITWTEENSIGRNIVNGFIRSGLIK